GHRRARDRAVRGVVHQEDELRAGRTSDADAIAVLERPIANLAAVEQRAAARPSIADDIPAIRLDDLGVLARDVVADQHEIVGRAPADRKRLFVDNDETPAQRVVHLEAWL